MRKLADSGTVRARVAAFGAVALLPLGVAACGGGESADAATGGATSTGTTATTQARGSGPQAYFSSGEFVGDTVTVSATVTEKLSARAFVLSGEKYGDESLLVLAKEIEPEVEEGQTLEVTGEVRKFAVTDYAEQYGLKDTAAFDPFKSEEFLVAKQVDKTATSG